MRFLTLPLLALSIFAGTLSAQAGPSLINNLLCAPAQQMRDKLRNQFGAEQAGQGIWSPDQVMELWQQPRNGNWTLVVAYATGTSCIVAMGEHWDQVSVESRG